MPKITKIKSLEYKNFKTSKQKKNQDKVQYYIFF